MCRLNGWHGSKIILPVYNDKDLILEVIELNQALNIINFLIKTHKFDLDVRCNATML